MADPILFTSPDRSLTNGGTSDLSLYGVQATPIVSFAETDPDEPIVDPLNTTGAAAQAPETSSDKPSSFIQPSDADTIALAPSGAALSAPMLAPQVQSQSTTMESDEPAYGEAMQALGSSTAPSLLTSDPSTSNPIDLDLTPPGDPLLPPASTTLVSPVDGGGLFGPAGLVSIPLPDLGPMTPLDDTAVSTAVAAADDILGAAAGTDATTIQSLTDTIGGSTAAVADASQAISDAAETLVDNTQDALEPVLDAAGATVTNAAIVAGDLAASSVAAASMPAVTLTAAASGAADDAQDLLGPDPAGGVATLVSLVTAADMFELSDAAPDSDVTVAAADDLLDSLSDDTPLPDILLGDADSDTDDAPLVPPVDPGPIDLPFG